MLNEVGDAVGEGEGMERSTAGACELPFVNTSQTEGGSPSKSHSYAVHTRRPVHTRPPVHTGPPVRTGLPSYRKAPSWGQV